MIPKGQEEGVTVLKRGLLIFSSLFLLFPTIVWAGFFSRDPVNIALDDYEADLGKARIQMTEPQRATRQARSTEVTAAKKVAGTGGERKTFETEAGFESYAYRYQETVGGERFMRLKGIFYGVFLKETFRPNQLDPIFSEYFDFFRFEGRFAWARLDYNGGVYLFDGLGNFVGSAPLDMSNIPDMVLETRLLAGKDLFWRDLTFTPYSGFGFRFLRDDQSDTTGTYTFEGEPGVANGYLRKSYYYYLPLGIDIKKPLTGSWILGTNAEFDYFLSGIQKSYIEGSGSVPTNHQRHGYGLRGSVRVEKSYGALGLSIEPFIRYWDIEDSDPNATGLEPSNTTREIGLKMGLTF